MVFSVICPSNPSFRVRSAVWIASSKPMSSLYLRSDQTMLTVLHTYDTYRFSRNVFALTMFFPIALAFHAQKDPDGSTWYNVGPLLMSQPATNNETPYGLTPLHTSCVS